MTVETGRPPNLIRHLVSLVAGVLAILSGFLAPSGVTGYLIGVAIGVAAVVVGHKSVRQPGPAQWAAGMGLGLSYLGLVVALGLLTTRIVRLASGSAPLLGG